MRNRMVYKCDLCGGNKEVQRTHFGYVRLICSDCAKELNAEIIQPKNKSKEKRKCTQEKNS